MRWLHAAVLLLVLAMLGSGSASAQLTPEQMYETARQWERAVLMQDLANIDRLWSDEGFFSRVTAKVDAPAEVRQKFLAGAGQNLGRMVVEQLLRTRGKTGGYKLLTIIKRPDGARAIFRVVGDNGLNYHELIGDTVDGAIRIVDIHVYLTGESFVQTLRRNYRAFAALQQNLPPPQDFLELQQMQKMLAEQNFRGVMNHFDGLPDELKREKSLQLLRVLAALRLGEPDYSRARSEYAACFANDPTPDLLSIDALLAAGRFEDC
ncbi:MAG: hypothetical protein RMJ35_14135, partial [Phycisphaerales bacterium]|nr:hypothetical protein [Phycisphaerales bacterium]